METAGVGRREILAASVGGAAALLAGCDNRAELSPRALPGIRRIVTTEPPDGATTVAFSEVLLNAVELNGSTFTRLWETEAVPAALPFRNDMGAKAGNAYREGFVGTSLYVADIPGRGKAEIPMHKQDSVDYITVLAGQINLVLPEEVLLMREGDILVQGGNLHTWENRGDHPCRLLVVVLRASRSA